MTSRTLGTYSDFAAASLRADCVVYAHQVPCFHVFSPCRWLSIWQMKDALCACMMQVVTVLGLLLVILPWDDEVMG